MSEIFYIGGYKKGDSDCLYCCEYSGGAINVRASYEAHNASYLCLSPNGKNLYAVSETNEFDGMPGGRVFAFAVEEGGRLRFLNDAPSGGGSPCYLSISADGRLLYTANYMGGSCIVHNLSDDGCIDSWRAFVDHSSFGTPSNVVPSRQSSLHAHYIAPKKIGAKEAVFACDLGFDAVLVFDGKGLIPTVLPMPGGFGARHMAFHPTLPMAYVVGELGRAVIALDYSDYSDYSNALYYSDTDGIKISHPVSVLPEGDATCAAIRVAPGGSHLLVSNRGGSMDSLSVLRLDDAGGVVGSPNVFMTKGKCPRDFVFTPKGDEIFVAYQDSDLIEVLTWHDGTIATKGVEFSTPKPTCVLFA